ncbi:hypothetical protein EIP86_006348 [Pleurotus ostreatoroseus]|nr:hypothetical protein EIP86_006348 [Pleurotus ostreatoroseus]
MSVDYGELPMPSLVRSATPGSSSCASSEGPSTPLQAHTYLSPAYFSPSVCSYSYSGWDQPVAYAGAHLSSLQRAYAPPAYCEEDIEMADVVSDEVAKYIGNHSAPCPWWESSDDAMEDIDDMYTTPYTEIQPQTVQDVEPTSSPTTVVVGDLVSRPQTTNVLAQGPLPQATEPVVQHIDCSGSNVASQSAPATAAGCLSDDTIPFPTLDDLLGAPYPDDGPEIDQDPLNFGPLPDIIDDIAQAGIDINELLATCYASHEPSLAAPATTEIDSPVNQPFDLSLALEQLNDSFSTYSILHNPTMTVTAGTDVYTSALTVNGSVQTTRDATDYSSVFPTPQDLPFGIIPSTDISTLTESLGIVAGDADGSIATAGFKPSELAGNSTLARSERPAEMLSVPEVIRPTPNPELDSDSALTQASCDPISDPATTESIPCPTLTASASEGQDSQSVCASIIQATIPVPVSDMQSVSTSATSDAEEVPLGDAVAPVSATAAATDVSVLGSRAEYVSTMVDAAEGEPAEDTNEDNFEDTGSYSSFDSDSTSDVYDATYEEMIEGGKITQGWGRREKSSFEEKEKRPKKDLPRRTTPMNIPTPGPSSLLPTPALSTTVDANLQRSVNYPTSSCAASSVETEPQQLHSVDCKGKGKDNGRATSSCPMIEAEQASGPSLFPDRMSPQSYPLDQIPVSDIAGEKMTTSAPDPARSYDSANTPRSCMPESSHRRDDSTPVLNLSFSFNSAPSGADTGANAGSAFVFGTEDFEAPMYPGEGILDFST